MKHFIFIDDDIFLSHLDAEPLFVTELIPAPSEWNFRLSPKFGFGYIAPDLLFVKSTDNRSNFDPPIQLLNKTAGGSGREQGTFIGVSSSERVIVLSVMSDNHNFRSNIFVSGSSENGTNFART